MTSMPRTQLLLRLAAAFFAFLMGNIASSQAPSGQKSEVSPSSKAGAPIDLTGYWVSVIDTDWRWRMVTPPKGDFNMVPIMPAAKTILDNWDPQKDEAAGEQCRAYGAAGLMRIPERLHITWADDNTLKVEVDAGLQTRVLRFAAPPTLISGAPPTWQGESVAHWDMPTGSKFGAKDAPKFGSVHVVTTHMRMGYLRKNGLPYSTDAVLTEDWVVMKEPDGTMWLSIATSVEDPVYLRTAWVTTPVFKREADGSKWDPSPCLAK